MTIFDAVGGSATFDRLVEAFYQGVATDPILRPMYPSDLEPSKRRLALFLSQYFGGPQTYSLERGHPRLRARHTGFRIDLGARDAWLGHMTAALGSLEITDAARAEFLRYFAGAADFLVNRK